MAIPRKELLPNGKLSKLYARQPEASTKNLWLIRRNARHAYRLGESSHSVGHCPEAMPIPRFGV